MLQRNRSQMEVSQPFSEKLWPSSSVSVDFQSTKDDADIQKKKKVGNYLLGKTLGEGSFAKVREGLHIISKEKVAVKVVSKRTFLLRDYVKRRVRREVVMLQRLEHPNIIRMYEIMETGNSYYLVLEMAESGDFVSYLAEKKCLSEAECRKYIRQMASALDHMHTSNIVHRDLKLENLLLDINYNIKIIDYGSSNVFYGESSLNTQCGSPVYAAPEVFSSKKYGSAVDVWSMGVCMYAMLTGKLPFMPSPPTNLTLLHILIMKGADIPKFLSDDCSEFLSALLTIDSHSRIKINDILVHNWLTEGYDSPIMTRQPPLGKLFPVVPNSFIVNYMTKMFNFQEDDIFYSVLERKMNAVAATYQLLLKHFEKGHNLIGAPTVGPQMPPLRLDFLNNNQKEKTDVSVKEDQDLPVIPREKSSLVASKPPVNLFKYSSSNYSEYKPREAKRNLSLRRRNSQLRIGKHTKTEEESGIIPDFILTYAHNEQVDYEIPERKYEWEQSFIVTKHGSVKSAKNNKINQAGDSFSHSTKEDSGKTLTPRRSTSSLSRRSQVCTPANSYIDETLIVAKSISGETTVSEKDSVTISCEDPCNERSWSSYHKQKSRLSRGMSLQSKRDQNIAYKAPIAAPKSLTPREAKSYFQEIANARVVGTGRPLLERAKTKYERFRYTTNHGFKPRTAPTGRELPSILSPDLTVNSQGVLQFPVVLGGRTVTPTVPRSSPARSPRYTVTDGVTDIIKVQITSATKR